MITKEKAMITKKEGKPQNSHLACNKKRKLGCGEVLRIMKGKLLLDLGTDICMQLLKLREFASPHLYILDADHVAAKKRELMVRFIRNILKKHRQNAERSTDSLLAFLLPPGCNSSQDVQHNHPTPNDAHP